ncbi:MAG: acylphosphatase [Patescibacteria group bacterium]
MNKVIITFYGRVQGVGLRVFIAQCAGEHNVTGTVQNKPDGTVQAELWGDKDQLAKYIEISARGSRFSRIENITTVWGVADHAPNNFRIL